MIEYIYHSQWSVEAGLKRNDCGPACVAMVLSAFGDADTVDALSREIMPGQDNATSQAALVGALVKRGVKARAWAGLTLPPTPCIALINYHGLDTASVQDKNFQANPKAWHWLLLLSINEQTVVVHDPDFGWSREQEGAFKHYSRREWDAAWQVYDKTKLAVVWDEPLPDVVVDARTLEMRVADCERDIATLKVWRAEREGDGR